MSYKFRKIVKNNRFGVNLANAIHLATKYFCSIEEHATRSKFEPVAGALADEVEDEGGRGCGCGRTRWSTVWRILDSRLALASPFSVNENDLLRSSVLVCPPPSIRQRKHLVIRHQITNAMFANLHSKQKLGYSSSFSCPSRASMPLFPLEFSCAFNLT